MKILTFKESAFLFRSTRAVIRVFIITAIVFTNLNFKSIKNGNEARLSMHFSY